MSPRRGHGPTLAAVLVILALLVGLAGTSLHYRTTLMQEAQARTRRLSLLLAEQAARTFESVDFTLRGLEPLLDADDPKSPATLDALLRKRVSELSFVQNIRVLDPQGAVIASSAPRPAAGAAGSDSCITALSLPTSPHLAIGCGSGDIGSEGQPSIAVARRLDGADRGATRIAVADINPGYFSRFFRDLNLGSRTVVTLTENHGHVLLASAVSGGGEHGPSVVPPTDHARLDQVQRASRNNITAIHETDGYPLSILVAVDRNDIEGRWQQAVMPAAVLTIVLSGLVLLLARIVERHRQERAQSQRRALAVQKMEAMGQMTASMAHDFRNILTVMHGTVHLIRRRGADPAVLAEADATIQRGNAMVDRLLAFSRRAELHPEPHRLDDLIKHLEGTLRHVAGADMALQLDLDPGLPPCQIDRTQFDAALMNLVVNARQASGAGGSVTIRSRPAPIGASVSVIDTGCGIDAATLKHVFEPFFTTKAEQGTGLGLAQVQAFAEQIGGTVAIDSTVGVGTTVTLILPRATAVPAKVAAASLLTFDPV